MPGNAAKIGIIGLGVMGSNLARNFANKKIPTAVFNRTTSVTENFIRDYGNKYLVPAATLNKFVHSLEKPRKILILVKSGAVVDEVLKNLIPLLEKNDIVVDVGNSFYKDTEKRAELVRKSGIDFWGCGISGGEKGALEGPSLMPGGEKSNWQRLKKLLEPVAAKDFKNKPCVSYMGDVGAGHYVKMVHNGIEYGLMEIMAEAYQILRDIYGLKAPEIAKIFQKINDRRLNAFLFDVAEIVLTKKDDQGGHDFLLDKILDQAGQKGTGNWTAIESFEHAVAVPTIAEAVYARMISSDKQLRKQLSINKMLTKKTGLSKFTKILEDALVSGFYLIFAQGLELVKKSSTTGKTDISEVCRIWQGGCIIRTKILKDFASMKKHPLELVKPKINADGIRKLITLSIENHIPVPGFSSLLAYFDSYTTANGPANLIQGLRDAFGAHTYERIDKPGIFHTDWTHK